MNLHLVLVITSLLVDDVGGLSMMLRLFTDHMCICQRAVLSWWFEFLVVLAIVFPYFQDTVEEGTQSLNEFSNYSNECYV